jgi:hypothetical protein
MAIMFSNLGFISKEGIAVKVTARIARIKK